MFNPVRHECQSSVLRFQCQRTLLLIAAATLIMSAVGCRNQEFSVEDTQAASIEAERGEANTQQNATEIDLPSLSPGRIDPEAADASSVVAEYLGYEVIQTIEHDTNAFTQGFELDGDKLFESTGAPGYTPLNTTTIREIDPATGEVLRSRDFGREYFGEGLTVVGDQLIQLTWKGQVAYLFDKDNFESTGTHSYEGEGWGLCYDGTELLMTDGSSTLFRRDPATFMIIDTVTVTRNGREVALLNELECVGDAVWANVWHSDEILKIDPRNGAVLEILDLTELAAPYRASNTEFVLNGITYNPETDRFLVTGKNWSAMYEIALVSANPASNTDSGDAPTDGATEEGSTDGGGTEEGSG